MKTTSIQANIAAEAFKGNHKDRIFNCMEKDENLTGNDIAERTGLTFVQVMRRCVDLVRDGRIKDTGSRKGFGTYSKLN